MKNTQNLTLVLTIAGLLSSPLTLAREHEKYPGEHREIVRGAQEMDHSGHDMSGHDMSGHDMSSMQAQGGDAPMDARDPHAYSNGYTLTEGPYAQPGPRQLKLADEHAFWAVIADRLEYDLESENTVFDLQGWYGTTFNRLVLKTEGEFSDGILEEVQADVLYSQAVSGYFDAQVGVRLDQYDEGKDRQWLAVGLQGLAPYWFELDISAYLGEDARTALAVEAEYELLFTQKLILQSRAELTAYGKEDVDNGIGSGLSSGAVGMRLRYEVSRQFAPYVGVEWSRGFSATADLMRDAGDHVTDTQYVAGLRFWF